MTTKTIALWAVSALLALTYLVTGPSGTGDAVAAEEIPSPVQVDVHVVGRAT